MTIAWANQHDWLLWANGEGDLQLAKIRPFQPSDYAWTLGVGFDPTWAPDGSYILYVDYSRQYFWQKPVTWGTDGKPYFGAPIKVGIIGTGLARPTIGGLGASQRLLFQANDPATGAREVWTSLNFGPPQRMYINAYAPCISYDGRWAVLTAGYGPWEDGKFHYEIMSFDFAGSQTGWYTTPWTFGPPYADAHMAEIGAPKGGIAYVTDTLRNRERPVAYQVFELTPNFNALDPATWGASDIARSAWSNDSFPKVGQSHARYNVGYPGPGSMVTNPTLLTWAEWTECDLSMIRDYVTNTTGSGSWAVDGYGSGSPPVQQSIGTANNGARFFNSIGARRTHSRRAAV